MKKAILFTLLVGSTPLFAQCPNVTADLTAIVKRIMIEYPSALDERVQSDYYFDKSTNRWGFDNFVHEWATHVESKISFHYDKQDLTVSFLEEKNGSCKYSIDGMFSFDLVRR